VTIPQVTRGDALDVVILLLAAWYAVRGYRRGLVFSVLSTGAFLLGAVLGSRLAPALVKALLSAQATSSAADKAVVQRALTVGIVLLLAVALERAGARLALLLRRVLHLMPFGLLDGAGGALLSAAGLLLIAWMLGTALGTSPYPRVVAEIRRSEVLALVDGALPGSARQQFTALLHSLESRSFPALFDPLGPLPRVLPVLPAPDAGVVPSALRGAGPSVVKIVGQAPECGTQSEGSGFVISPEHVLTNAHVVAGVRTMTVTTPGPNGRTLAATVVLFDSRRDVAVLYVPGLHRPALAFGGPLERGASAVVVGYPEGGPFTAVPARVEGRQEVTGPDIYQQSDVTRDVYSLRADVRPGNSGGPLLGTDGRVDGVVFAKGTDSPQQGYALTAGEVAPDVRTGSTASTAVSTSTCD
jgi:S1-C subfamily serine protease